MHVRGPETENDRSGAFQDLVNNACKISPAGPPRCSSRWCLSPGVIASDLSPFLKKAFGRNCCIPNFARWNTVEIFTRYLVSLVAFDIPGPLVKDCNLTYWPGEQSLDSYLDGEEVLVERGQREKKVSEFCRSEGMPQEGIICSATSIPRWHLIKSIHKKDGGAPPLRAN